MKERIVTGALATGLILTGTACGGEGANSAADQQGRSSVSREGHLAEAMESDGFTIADVHDLNDSTIYFGKFNQAKAISIGRHCVLYDVYYETDKADNGTYDTHNYTWKTYEKSVELDYVFETAQEAVVVVPQLKNCLADWDS